jgi:hypothetical protein
VTHETIATQSPCPQCGKKLGAATNIDGKAHSPRPGDLSVCAYCGLMLTFNEDGRCRELLRQEFFELPDDKALLMIRAQRLILTRKHQLN